MSSRIFGRYLPLNKARTIGLDVGITILPEPHVSIALIGQGWGQEILLSEEAWEKLNDSRTCILRYLLETSSNKPASLNLDDNTTIKFSTVEERGAVCLTVPDTEIIMMTETCQTLIRLHDTVRSKIAELKAVLPMLKSRLNTFVDIVRVLESKYMAYNAITSSPKFRKVSQLDNELVVLALDDIIKLAKPDVILSIEETFTLAE